MSSRPGGCPYLSSEVGLSPSLLSALSRSPSLDSVHYGVPPKRRCDLYGGLEGQDVGCSRRQRGSDSNSDRQSSILPVLLSSSSWAFSSHLYGTVLPLRTVRFRGCRGSAPVTSSWASAPRFRRDVPSPLPGTFRVLKRRGVSSEGTPERFKATDWTSQRKSTKTEMCVMTWLKPQAIQIPPLRGESCQPCGLHPSRSRVPTGPPAQHPQVPSPTVRTGSGSGTRFPRISPAMPSRLVP